MKIKHFTLIIFTTIIYAAASAQPVIARQWGAGSSGADYLKSISHTIDKGLIAGGNSTGNASCQKTENNRDSTGTTNDYWVVKFDISGAIQWDKTIGGSKEDQLVTVQQTFDGGYIAGGSSYSSKSGDKTQNSRGENDYWVVKLDSTGIIQRQRTVGGGASDQLYSVQQDSDSGYTLIGYSQSGKSGEKTVNGTGYWMVKLNKTGVKQSDKIIPAPKQTKDGGYIGVGGVTLTKWDSTGKVEWSQVIAPSSADLDHDGDFDGYLSYVEQTDGGGYIVGGTLGPASGPFEGKSYWVIKTDKLGVRLWSKTYGHEPDEAYNILTSLQPTNDHGYIIVGTTDYPSYQTGNYNTNFYVVKTDKNGNFQWDKSIDASNDEKGTIVTAITKDRFLIGGSSLSGVGRDKTVGFCADNNTSDDMELFDYWIVRLDYSNPQSLSMAKSATDQMINYKPGDINFIIYPNPAKNVLHVQTDGNAIISLIDGTGRVLLTQSITGSGTINVSKLQPGMYYLKKSTTGETRKVLIGK